MNTLTKMQEYIGLLQAIRRAPEKFIGGRHFAAMSDDQVFAAWGRRDSEIDKIFSMPGTSLRRGIVGITALSRIEGVSIREMKDIVSLSPTLNGTARRRGRGWVVWKVVFFCRMCGRAGVKTKPAMKVICQSCGKIHSLGKRRKKAAEQLEAQFGILSMQLNERIEKHV